MEIKVRTKYLNNRKNSNSIFTAFASTFYFFADTQATKKKIKRACKQPHGTLLTCTGRALNVNRFEQSACKLGRTRLRTDRRTADNIRLKEILKKGALTVIRTVVHLTNSCGYTNSRASNPPFLKLL